MQMGIRETIQKHRGATTVLAVLFCVGGIALTVWSNGSDVPSPLAKAFYSDDDGKSCFVDDINKIAPFDRGGKPAYRAFVYRYGNGQPFVGYLSGLSDKGLEQVKALPGKPQDAEFISSLNVINQQYTVVKKPGEKRWVPITSPEAGAIVTPKPPAGAGSSGGLEAVYP